MQKCIPADMDMQAHRPREPHRDIHGQIRLHSHTLTQMHKRNIQSHTHAQNLSQIHRDTGMQTETEKYMDSHPCRCTKVLTPKLVQIRLYRFTHMNTFHVNGHGDPQIYLNKHRGTREHKHAYLCTQTQKGMHPHWQSPAHLHRHTVAQTRVCIAICTHANRSGHRFHRGIHKPRGTETQQNTLGRFPYTESSNAHGGINTYTWTHRCIHSESHPKTLVLMQTDLCRLTHTHVPVDMRMVTQIYTSNQRWRNRCMNTKACMCEQRSRETDRGLQARMYTCRHMDSHPYTHLCHVHRYTDMQRPTQMNICKQ